MDEGNQVQDENLVNDQVTQAIADGGAVGAVTEPTATPAVPTVPTEPVAVPTPEVHSGTAEAAVLNTAPVTAPMIDTPDEVTPDTGEDDETEEETPAVVQAAPEVGGVTGDGSDEELMTVKQAALEQLSPLVDHLDLPPDQKFDTYMEILRASDDKSLVQPAFEEAQKIDDEDKKAQALLDVVNEVNYLTQDHEAAE